MHTASVRFPVVCPDCGGQALAVFPIADLCAALLADKAIPLRSPCHRRTWDASILERAQIRQYLAVLAPSTAIRVFEQSASPNRPRHVSDSG